MATVFDHQDGDYLAWLEANEGGYVVNAFRNLDPGYLRLHRASCAKITRLATNAKTWTNGDYVKICAATRQDIERWARESTRGTLQPCGLCHPE